ncbi:tubulin beta chain-like [Toxorhynchites rutilus septentrionalis]|uniref:tubulin beta chain-like n=1 Tax=Toxorhynchites rutilus septentrionalis TaxID=329112 RepID=UPI00247A7A72|nr:tubulin beta chain-like [Toxorhynchites rutilus septentrionalis]
MREIIALHLGQCGNKIAESFWETICEEHCLNERGQFIGKHYLPLQRINVYFEESPCCNFVPRAIFADLEPGTLNGLRCSRYGKLFSPESMVCGMPGAGNNWARGYHTEGAELLDELLNVARKMCEGCDCLQGFQLVHSIGGGTGSGLGSVLMENLKDEFPRKILNTFSVIPSPKVSEVVVEPYNAVFALNTMINNSDETFCLDNEALYDINASALRVARPGLDDLNHLISMAMTGITCSFRYPGQLNSDLRKLLTNMVPYQRLHFFVPGVAPLTSKENQCYKQISVPELVYQLFDERNLMAACGPSKGQYLTAAALFRGRVSTRNVEEQMANIRQKNSSSFSQWIPNNVKSAICDIPPRGLKIAATFIANTTSITQLFNRLLDQFGTMFRRKAFLHWYIGEGMEEREFTDAEQGLRELVNEYEAHETTTELRGGDGN